MLPSRTTPALSSRYSKLAALWSGRGNVTIVKDSDISALPTEGAIWVFGARNKYYGIVKNAMSAYDASIGDKTVVLGGKDLAISDNSTIIAVRHPKDPEVVVVGLTVHSDAAVEGLARKLPHYPGAKAGLMKGDIITHFGGAPVKDLQAYTNELAKYKPDDKVKVMVERAGNTVKLEMVLAKR